ncbi:Hypothetical protein TON_1856 [Thermococcus onnurineus NA1]|uniref:Probable thymidylate kinase n=1 Tax=Thermococcus onnurineus (strain NA1) TaxID=523850 RepID=B6YVM3_THEON|nr:hypothetical protein [Thermococcus onnurineus]ACJ17347.1 Hypothetical protein TON_1856 [Thermococcus onnurineus NA1]
MDPPRLICIIGPDGTGKTTQAKMLIEKLREMGYEYEYRWMRFHHFISLPVLALARLMGLTEIQTLPDGRKIGYHHFYRSKLISTVYPITLYLDMLLAMIFKIYIPLKVQRKRLVCDRFIYDTLVDLTIDLDNIEFDNSKTAKKFLKLIPRDCLTILLIAPYEKIKERREDLKFDKYLRKRIETYMELKKRFPQLVTIDASSEVEKVHNQIVEIVVGENESAL